MSFTKLNADDIVISADSIASTLWTGDLPGLAKFFTSSGQYTPNGFYLDVYGTGSTLSGSDVQFSMAYGHVRGSGSLAINPSIPYNSKSRVIYGQFRNLIYGDENSYFNFGVGNTSSFDIYTLTINRARYKEKLFVGTFNLYLSGSNEIQLTDNSRDLSTVTYCDAGRIYDIVSGSNGRAITSAPFPGITSGYTPSGSYGKFLPDVGLIILNPRALGLPAASGGIALSVTTSSNAANSNIMNLFTAMSASGANSSNPTGSFFLNSEETITSDYIFVRIKNSEYNYTTNPSMISGSGDFVYSNFVNNPQTYPTTVGLYNDNNDLLAVAKFSRPLTKDFTKESLLRVKLDF
jgi:hypothetical protein